MPGIISTLISVLMCVLASEEIYGPSLYLLFPRCAPEEGTDELEAAKAKLSSIEAGEGRSLGMQAVYQLIAMGVTLAIAIVGGAVTGSYKI